MSGITKKNIDQSLKFVYSDNNSLSVIFHDNNLLMGVVGEFNKNISLKRLEIVQDKLFNNQIKINKTFENTIQNVLVENRSENNSKLFGRSEYMTSVLFDGNDDLIGKTVNVKILSSNRSTLFGELSQQSNQKGA